MKLQIDISTNEKKKELFDLFKTFKYKSEIFKYFNIARTPSSNQYLDSVLNEIGFTKKDFKQKDKKYCLECGKELKPSQIKFCSSSCAATYNNKLRIVSQETKNKISNTLSRKIKDYETEGKTYNTRLTLRDRLIRDGLKKYKCECCGNDSWMGGYLVLEVHHINGDHFDNSLENLQLLCPNCHSQTDTYKSKNVSKIKYEKNVCKICGKELNGRRKTKMCFECFQKKYNSASEKKPSKEILEKDYETIKTLCGLAKKYNVCNKTIKKWLIQYNLINS